jgi:hypothetical protein
MKSRRSVLILIASVLCLSALLVGAAGFATNTLDNHSASPVKVSTQGKRLPYLSKSSVRRQLADAPATKSLSLLSVIGDLAFYRVGTPRDNCYGVGAASSVGDPFQIKCWDADTALMDLSTAEITPQTGGVRLLRVAGIAADGVASVGLKSANGDITDRVPVIGNVYVLESPPVATVHGVVGFDAEGKALHEIRTR